MIEINRKITPYNYTPMSSKKNEYIVIHYVGGVSSAKNNADYFAKNQLKESANYFVDENSIWQSVGDLDRAWHCGDPLQKTGGGSFNGKCTNSNSIGIEMCCKKTAGGAWYFEEDTVKNTAELTKQLMEKYSIPIERVIRHYDVTGKLCPAPYIDETAWADFKNRLTDKEDEPMIYNYIDENMPEWARPYVQKAVDLGIIKGNGNGLNLTDDKIWTLVVILRATGIME